MKTIALSALLALTVAGSARAQSSNYEPLGPGLPAGHFNLYPSVAYEYTYDDNILFMSSDLPGSVPIASGVNVLRARLLADLPLRDGRLRMVYAPFYRTYTNDRFQPEDRLNQVAGVEGAFHKSGRVTFGVRDDYANGTLSLQEQGARNGVPFGLGHYSIHNPRMDLGVRIAPRQGFSILPSYSHSEFSGLVSGFGQAVDYGYTTQAIEGRYNYQLREPMTVYLSSTIDHTVQTLSDSPDVSIDSNIIGLGFTRTLDASLVTQAFLGYETMQFDGGFGEDFSGVVGEANVAFEVAPLNRMNVSVLRRPYASIYLDSNYYMATAGQVRWTRQVGRSSYVDAGATIQENDFVPLQGVGRKERLMRLEVGLGHEFQKHLRCYAGFNVEQRESNVLLMAGGAGADPFEYQLHRFIIRIEAGWM